MEEYFDIKIKSMSSQDQIAEYLVKAALGLRDRENKSESVRLFGCGSAIPNVILVAEIIRARFKGLSSIATLENMQKDVEENGIKQTISIPAIRIKLTCNPTQEEQNQAGYQAPGDVKDDKKFELFSYVMIYTQNLFFLKGKNRQRQNNNTSNKHQFQKHEKVELTNQFQEEERGQMKYRGNAQVQRRRPDDTEQNENNKKDDRDRYQSRGGGNFRGKPKPNSNFLSQKEGEIRPKQGEIKTRGGNRK